EPYSEYRFLGGHRLQGLPYNDGPHARLLALNTVRDMIVLCDKILSRSVKGHRSRLIPGIRLKVFADGDASIVTRGYKIR
ncbi:MAG: hypothetical protein MJ099_06240, partial [Clostridia bacterium]|nr:hypothetical protein [Clostridia bacterium]